MPAPRQVGSGRVSAVERVAMTALPLLLYALVPGLTPLFWANVRAGERGRGPGSGWVPSHTGGAWVELA